MGILKLAVRGVPAKDVGRVSGAEVRILFPTPYTKKDRFLPVLFCIRVKAVARAYICGFATNEVRKSAEVIWELAHKELGVTHFPTENVSSFVYVTTQSLTLPRVYGII